jgi:hypothetical protein
VPIVHQRADAGSRVGVRVMIAGTVSADRGTATRTGAGIDDGLASTTPSQPADPPTRRRLPVHQFLGTALTGPAR